MTHRTPSRRLHFHTRHHSYEQAIGYGYFMNTVLAKLNSETPPFTRELLERTAALMDGHEERRGGKVFLQCLPEILRQRCNITEDFFDPTTSRGKKHAAEFFGPAAHPLFGVLYPELHQWRVETAIGEGRLVEKNFYDLFTPILTRAAVRPRGYFDVLSGYYPGLDLFIPPDFMVKFDYPIPGSQEKLPLMQISSPQHLWEELKFSIPEERREGAKQQFMKNLENYVLVFCHPRCDAEYFAKLTRCIEPLLTTLDAPAGKVAAGAKPPEEKLDAMITIYWLLAQSTPVVRGGGGYAMVMLEHMAHRLQMQGYDYTIPYMKEGVDLWAQAATLPLEDTPGRKGFKSRFKEGLFFDPQAKNEDIMHYFANQMQRNGEKSYAPPRQRVDSGRDIVSP